MTEISRSEIQLKKPSLRERIHRRLVQSEGRTVMFRKMLGLSVEQGAGLPKIEEMPVRFSLPKDVIQKIAELNELSFLGDTADGKERAVFGYLKGRGNTTADIIWGKVLKENFVDKINRGKGIKVKKQLMTPLFPPRAPFIQIHTHPPTIEWKTWPFTGTDLNFLLTDKFMLELISGPWGVYGLIKSGDFDFNRWEDNLGSRELSQLLSMDSRLKEITGDLQEKIRAERDAFPSWGEYSTVWSAFCAEYGIVLYSSNPGVYKFSPWGGKVREEKPVQRGGLVEMIKIGLNFY